MTFSRHEIDGALDYGGTPFRVVRVLAVVCFGLAAVAAVATVAVARHLATRASCPSGSVRLLDVESLIPWVSGVLGLIAAAVGVRLWTVRVLAAKALPPVSVYAVVVAVLACLVGVEPWVSGVLGLIAFVVGVRLRTARNLSAKPRTRVPGYVVGVAVLAGLVGFAAVAAAGSVRSTGTEGCWSMF